MGKKIGILGGSFNPPHEGHLRAAETARAACQLDEVWLMVSPGNPQKDPAQYAPFEDRLIMCKMLAAGQPWLFASAIEQEMGTRRTYDTLNKLRERYPDDELIWVMGSDNLRDLHTWHRWQDILTGWPLAVNIRKDQEQEALNSPAARMGERFKAASGKALEPAPSWCMFSNQDAGLSSRHIRAAITNDKINNVSALFNALTAPQAPRAQSLRDVAYYIARHDLYRQPAQNHKNNPRLRIN